MGKEAKCAIQGGVDRAQKQNLPTSERAEFSSAKGVGL